MTEPQSTPHSHQPAGPTAGPQINASSSPPHTSVLQPYALNNGKSANKQLRTVYVLVLILAVLLAAQWWSSHNENVKLRTEMARRLQVGDSSNNDTKVVVKSVQDGTKELQAKVAVLENKQVESQSQQLALAQLYQDLSKNGDDWALSEVEDVLSTASQQLQLAGNVSGALIALENADKNLARSDKPQFVIIRSAIAHDIDRLKALPTLDTTGIAVRLDSLISQIDSLPLLSDVQPVAVASQPINAPASPPINQSVEKLSNKGSHPVGSKGSKANDANLVGKTAFDNTTSINGQLRTNWGDVIKQTWQSWTAEMWVEIGQLIRVRTVNSPDALLLSPTQAYYARENLKLRLLNARLGLLSHNESAFRSDLIAAQETITKYFDTRAKQTQTAQALLKQIQGNNLSINMPALDSLAAIRTYKNKR
ncbi:uroporphyrinogen-III C-methyltransferase [Glaciimonas sp. CA11.2]|uniref:uroporphyrinogen-III C-methyltransferase n=1 Tax=unclassified Glaciimonas TaxID=2644401 RepID=UPI002AB4E60B|nr:MULTISPECIES: uroporphyrinogen-III C-methyltransferase [unclassified Glaciimonas]MDY7544828.1 uroporphyrinogen-III C-methyltransferase [Glaciimonas sp. CA11.2]MEB0014310.1 uroporphyrinogen-III C-methyltransferase [Glaciimonas sp. Cout2]MEB0084119.1 uroporphyrinogen-III C-methyltransferase [Glaciimonas sp. Gout2]MEB0163664.1 uroporphyrinogen-III C-methyltransferase [Glaciimonas sp. CA11.2]